MEPLLKLALNPMAHARPSPNLCERIGAMLTRNAKAESRPTNDTVEWYEVATLYSLAADAFEAASEATRIVHVAETYKAEADRLRRIAENPLSAFMGRD